MTKFVCPYCDHVFSKSIFREFLQCNECGQEFPVPRQTKEELDKQAEERRKTEPYPGISKD